MMLLFSFGLIAVYLFAKANDVDKENPAIEDDDAEPVMLASNTRELLTESRFEPIPSVVENTTELLPIDRK